jgi:hypothetical protein
MDAKSLGLENIPVVGYDVAVSYDLLDNLASRVSQVPFVLLLPVSFFFLLLSLGFSSFANQIVKASKYVVITDKVLLLPFPFSSV